MPVKHFKYNNHPNFARGSYTLDEVDISESFLSSSEIEERDKALILYVITGIKELNVTENGFLSINTFENGEDSSGESPPSGYNIKDADINLVLSDLSLSRIRKHTKKPNERDISSDFLRNLQSEPIKSFSVRSLLEENSEHNPNIRGSLEETFRKYIRKNVTIEEKDLFEYLGWDYIPFCQQVKLYLLFKEPNFMIKIGFKLLPGVKPLQIVKSEISLLRTKSTYKYQGNVPIYTILKQYTLETKVGECTIRPCELNLREYIVLTYVNYNKTHDAISHESTRENCSYETKVLQISGTPRRQFNTLSKILDTLNRVLPTNNYKYRDYNQPVYKIPKYRKQNSINLQLLNIYVNGKFRTFVPLVAYLDVNTGKWFLCSNIVQIDDVFKHSSLWYPWNHYARYNMNIIPTQYRYSTFASTDNIIFNNKDLEKIVSNHRCFSKYNIYNDSEDTVKNIIHVNKPGQNSFNIVV
ncbi:hypothetical protein BEWA_034430 [Theileria equi strain WA]|uniref:Uncharacterized protein n=1 Tax=Theileria equi strain WA TaxID=1537102 RepID=L0AYE0_THEEQ|nr:hypothetical protein BEWA_034430 [Theileria equi strain WA]AFZ80585.1 hypothetical protein BEWA_034430 [Theileria equi strain WA]|eukprot:XP_004830251.1 hypothetical protein BEWA_034430 [Theileria equi strain WA]